MSDGEMNDHKSSWSKEDFIDPPNLDVVEDDPWSISSDRADATVTPSLPIGGETASRDFGISETKSDIAAPIGQLDDSQITNDQPDTEALGLSDGDDWEHDDQYLADPESVDEYIDYLREPEPLAEYDSGLAEPLYESEGDASNLPLRLRLDELIARVENATDIQRNQIVEALSKFTVRQLSNWILWLREKRWTGHSLLLFLEFRALWDNSPEWWESSYWSHRLGHWLLSSSRANLSRDATYVLIQRRLHCEPDEIIDPSWLEEWDDPAVWECGILSFASFAVFRAELNNDEDWRSRLIWILDSTFEVESKYLILGNSDDPARDIVDSFTGRFRVWEEDTPHRTRPHGPPLWFAVQDWYDPVEWHDNLGWAYRWRDERHPYLPDTPSSTTDNARKGHNVKH